MASRPSFSIGQWSTTTNDQTITRSLADTTVGYGILFLTVAARDTAALSEPTIGGTSGLSWTLVRWESWDTNRIGVGVWWTEAPSNVGGTVTATFSVTADSLALHVDRVWNVDRTAPIVQSVFATGNSSAPSATLAAFTGTESSTFGAVAAGSTGTLSSGTAFDDLEESQVGTLDLLTEEAVSQETTVDASLSGGDSEWGVIGIEVKAAAELLHFAGYISTLSSSSAGAWSHYGPAIYAQALRPYTKYLAVAKMQFGVNSVTDKVMIRMNLPGDPAVQTKSQTSYEMTATGTTDLKPYRFNHSFFSSQKVTGFTNQYGFGRQTENSVAGRYDQASWLFLDLDQFSSKGYFNGTVTDPDASWADDANIADGDHASDASELDAGSVSSNYIQVVGTNGVLVDGNMKVRVWADFAVSDGVMGIRVRSDSDTLLETTQDVTHTTLRAYEFDLSEPTGGWTQAKVDGLELRIWKVSGTVAMNVNLVDVLDVSYFEDIQVDPGDGNPGDEYSTTAATTVVAQISGSDLGTVEHLILGMARVHVGSSGRTFIHELYTAQDAASSSVSNRAEEEGEDTAEERITGFAARHKASSGTPNVTLYGEEEAANGNMWDGGGYLIALPTSWFTDFEYDYTAGAITANGETTIATTGSYTPTEGGTHLLMGEASRSVATSTRAGELWLESSTTEIFTGDSAIVQHMVWDAAKDLERSHTLQPYEITSAETINLQGDNGGATGGLEYRWLIAVNLHEARPVIAGPLLSRRQLTTVRM
jgi:hypothetical protein